MRLRSPAVVVCALLVSTCENPVAPNPVDPACEALRATYSLNYGLTTFSDPNARSETIPWCMKSGKNQVTLDLTVPIVRAGDVKLTLTDIRPSTQFRLDVLPKGCNAPQQAPVPVFQFGTGTDWTIAATPGDYCFRVYKGNPELDVWVTFVLQRP